MLLAYMGFLRRVLKGMTLVRHTPVRDFHPRRARARVLILGDSSAAGTGAKNARHTVAGYLAHDYPDFDIINDGKVGMTVKKLKRRLDHWSAHHFDLLMIHIGGNDAVGLFLNLEKIRSEMIECLSLAKNISPHVLLISGGNMGLAPLVPKPLRSLAREHALAIRNLFRDLARTLSVIYVDMFFEKEKDPFTKNPRLYFAADGLHPSEAGYRVWYELILLRLERAKINLDKLGRRRPILRAV